MRKKPSAFPVGLYGMLLFALCWLTLPGAFAPLDELIALCKPLAARQLPYATHMRNEDDRLIEAIDSIRDDFEKILVVTHLDELKEFFPARIEVTKGDAGSQLMVLA